MMKDSMAWEVSCCVVRCNVMAGAVHRVPTQLKGSGILYYTMRCKKLTRLIVYDYGTNTGAELNLARCRRGRR